MNFSRQMLMSVREAATPVRTGRPASTTWEVSDVKTPWCVNLVPDPARTREAAPVSDAMH